MPRLVPRALELLESYDWPGNVRQLENCLEQAVVLCEGDRIEVSDLPLGADHYEERGGDDRALPPGLTLQELEQQYILQTLARVGQNRTQAAALLGVSLRCLQYKLKAYRHAEAIARPDGSAGEPSRIVPPGARRGVSSLGDVMLGDRRRMMMS